jgi:formylglycine-generating enzyme required for sulfatase activity
MTFQEWLNADGTGPYSWGSTFPPPENAGNFRDEAFVSTYARTRFLHSDNAMPLDYEPYPAGSFIKINDGYDRTSPVGSFAPNRYGLYDMAGNVWQWLEDSGAGTKTDSNPGGAAGGSWNTFVPGDFAVNVVRTPESLRTDDIGFRVVLALSSP